MNRKSDETFQRVHSYEDISIPDKDDDLGPFWSKLKCNEN